MSNLLTNVHNIPLTLALFFAGDDYDGHSDDPYNISVTTLLRSTRQIVLQRRLPDNLAMDISSKTKSRLGQAYHKGIEDAWLSEELTNNLDRLGIPKRLSKNIRINPSKEELLDNPDIIPMYFELRTQKKVGKWTITGKFDQVMNGVLEDNKSTGVFAYINQSNVTKWAMQGSLYRWLNPEIITEDYMTINYLFTDWSAGRARSDKKYPPLDIAWQNLNLDSYNQTNQFVSNKLKEIEKYTDTPEEELPLCTDEDLWRSEAVYKYYSKPDSTRSSKNFSNRFEAESHVVNKGKGHIVTSPGEVKACKYCAAFTICSQGQSYLQTGELKI